MNTQTELQQYLTLVDQLVGIATKEDLAECARLLALNLAHYELKFGSLPLDGTLSLAYSEEPNDQQVEIVTKGMGEPSRGVGWVDARV